MLYRDKVRYSFDLLNIDLSRLVAKICSRFGQLFTTAGLQTLLDYFYSIGFKRAAAGPLRRANKAAATGIKLF